MSSKSALKNGKEDQSFPLLRFPFLFFPFVVFYLICPLNLEVSTNEKSALVPVIAYVKERQSLGSPSFLCLSPSFLRRMPLHMISFDLSLYSLPTTLFFDEPYPV